MRSAGLLEAHGCVHNEMCNSDPRIVCAVRGPLIRAWWVDEGMCWFRPAQASASRIPENSKKPVKREPRALVVLTRCGWAAAHPIRSRPPTLPPRVPGPGDDSPECRHVEAARRSQHAHVSMVPALYAPGAVKPCGGHVVLQVTVEIGGCVTTPAPPFKARPSARRYSARSQSCCQCNSHGALHPGVAERPVAAGTCCGPCKPYACVGCRRHGGRRRTRELHRARTVRPF